MHHQSTSPTFLRQMRINVSSEIMGIIPELNYLFKILGAKKNVDFELVESDDKARYTIGYQSINTFRISENFVQQSLHASQLTESGFFESTRGVPDYLATAFFCLTSLQEHNDNKPDNLGRFQYKNSYQYRLGNIKKNLVQDCFNKILATLNLNVKPVKSTFFLSHDIDTVHGAIKEDGFNVLKKGRFDLFLSMLFKLAMGKPAWLNIDQIMKIESEYDCRSTFYWIVNKGNLDNIQKNADYDFQSSKIQHHFKQVAALGFENGIHKSLAKESFHAEIKKFGTFPQGNRYHYLKFRLHAGYTDIEEAGLQLDASLGFSEQYGFRNNYGLPFNPYNFAKRKPYSFVEMPLHVMDRTFFNRKMDLQSVENEIFGFFEGNKENAVLSLLWHNNFFTEFKYKGYLSLYKKILAYIKEGNFGTINQTEIIQKYNITWP